MTRPSACLFDLDGLLLDTEPLHGQAWQEAAGHFGAALSRQQLLQLRDRRRLDCAEQVRHWIGAAALPVPSVEALLAVRQPIAEALMLQAPPMEGARSLLERCAALRIPMALATSSSSAAVAHKSTPHPWLGLITVRVHGDDPALRAGKPEPDVFLLAAERLGVEPRHCWAFEDSPAGATAAARAGCLVHVVAPEDLPRQAYPGGVIWLESLNALQF